MTIPTNQLLSCTNNYVMQLYVHTARTLLVVGGIFFGFQFSTFPAQAKGNDITLVRSFKKRERIEQVSWFQPTWVDINKNIVRFTGKLSLDDYIVIHDYKVLVIVDESENMFEDTVELTGAVTPVNIELVSPMGDILKERFYIQVDSLKSVAKPIADSKKEQSDSILDYVGRVFRNRFRYSAGLGVSKINYSEGSIYNINLLGITGKVGLVFAQGPWWEFGGNTYITILPFSITGTEKTLRFFGMNFKAGYKIPMIKSPWSLQVNGGVFIGRTLVTGSSFGYEYLLFPQIYLSLGRRWNYLFKSGIYLKYAPISDQFFSLSPTSRELAFGALHYWDRETGKIDYSLELDYSTLKIVTEKSIEINTSSFSLSVSGHF